MNTTSRNRILSFASVMIILTTIGAGCDKKETITQTSPGTNKRVTINIDQGVFRPKTTTVKAGTTIVWSNRDTIPRTITTNTTGATSTEIAAGASYEYTYPTPGKYLYHLANDPKKIGTVVVQ